MRVTLTELQPMLKKMFDESTSAVTERAKRQNKSLDSAWRAFESACSSFYNLGAEPDLEDLHRIKREEIDALKASYVNALLETVGEADIGADAKEKTRYEASMDEFRMHETRMKRLLQVNYRFKPVIIAYAKHLGGFKAASSELERGMGELKRTLDAEAGGFASYRKILDDVRELHARIEGADALERTSKMSAGTGSAVAGRDAEALKGVTKEQARKLEQLAVRLAEKRMEINIIVQPLERVAKKYDHKTMQKEKLHEYLLNKELIIERHERFAEMLKGLEGAVSDGTVDTKNREATIEKINKAMGGLRGLIDEERRIETERKNATADLEAQQSELNEALSAAKSELERKRKAEQLSKRVAELEAEKRDAKEKIEKEVLDTYGKRISIIL